MKSKSCYLLLLVFSILAISLFYDYQGMFHLLPQGSHLWRQTYSMDMVLNYKLYHLPFLQPEVSNLCSIKGKAAAEFPVFYYIAAQFKESEFTLRVIHTFFFISGIIAAFYIAFYFLKDRLLAFIVMTLLFSSPLLVFYGNNFLSDVPALSFAYMAWAFYLYASKSKYSFLCYSIFFLLMSFSCLLKASQAINYGMLLALTIFQPSAPLRKGKYIVVWLLSLLPVYCWYDYARIYNSENQHTYYFLGISPIWKLSMYDIGLTGWRILVSWSKNYFWRPTSILLILCIILYWKYRKRIASELNLFILSSFLLTMAYIILFYERLMKHEYYYTTFFIFLLFWIIAVLYICKRFYGEIISWIKVFAVVLLLINIIYCKIFISEKLNDTHYNNYLADQETQDFLIASGVTQQKIIVSIPDETPCQTLYLLKRKGYTEFNDYLSALKNKRADYLILGNDSWKQNGRLKPYLNDSIGYYNGITLYKLN